MQPKGLSGNFIPGSPFSFAWILLISLREYLGLGEHWQVEPSGIEKNVDEPRNHPLLWVLAIFLLFLSVPFYYPEGRTPTLYYGLPDWCWITLFADTAFACLTSYLVLKTWADPSEKE